MDNHALCIDDMCVDNCTLEEETLQNNQHQRECHTCSQWTFRVCRPEDPGLRELYEGVPQIKAWDQIASPVLAEAPQWSEPIKGASSLEARRADRAA